MAKPRVEHVARVIMTDAKLTHHLRQAEEHLIEAVRLFELDNRPNRGTEYIERLKRMQEGVSTLLRMELVRERGPIKSTNGVKIKISPTRKR